MQEYLNRLDAFFREHQNSALAFSGGTDSALVLYAGAKWGIRPYYVKTAFQPEFEYRDALRLCEELKIPLRVIELDVLACPEVVENPKNRCYFCKRWIMGAIKAAMAEDGMTVLLDGSNLSDDPADRPGMKALEEFEILSPLRICGMTKSMVREVSRYVGLFTWDKPAYACLATRMEAGKPITAEMLSKTEQAEDAMRALGFSDFRVRVFTGAARIQVKESQLPLVLEKRAEIMTALKPLYGTVLLDLQER